MVGQTIEPAEEEKAKAFIDEYKALCQKYGLTTTLRPEWRQSLDTGNWYMVLVPCVMRITERQG